MAIGMTFKNYLKLWVSRRPLRFLENKPIEQGAIIAPRLSTISICILKNMHKEILTKEQINLLPLVKLFSKDFYLVGGTAMALQIGHRESVDFDLFTAKSFSNIAIKNKITKHEKIEKVLVNKLEEFTFLIKDVRFTFYNYPFVVEAKESFDNVIQIPDILTLSAMKAYAL